MYDAADSIMGQKLSQIEGVGQVFVGVRRKPAVRIEANPNLLNKLTSAWRLYVPRSRRKTPTRLWACCRAAIRAGSSIPTTSSSEGEVYENLVCLPQWRTSASFRCRNRHRLLLEYL